MKDEQRCHVQSAVKLLNKQSSKITSKKLQEVYLKEFNTNTHSLSQRSFTESHNPSLYVFVSLSMPTKGLIELGREAKKYNGGLILRGLYQGSYQKTAAYLKEFIDKTGTGIIIDPTLFKTYKIQSVPTIVVESSPEVYDKISGFISLKAALEIVEKEGIVADKAREILKKGIF